MRHALTSLLVACTLVVPQARADEDDEAAIDVMVSAAGEVLALGDLCGWDFPAKTEKLFRDAAKALQLTVAQQKDFRTKVIATRHATFGKFSAAGQARMRADVCKPEERARLEGIIAQISFD